MCTYLHHFGFSLLKSSLAALSETFYPANLPARVSASPKVDLQCYIES